MSRRRKISPFNLSFLDIMFCGFGAVVLLVLILDSATVQARKEVHLDLRAEVLSVEKRLAEQHKRFTKLNENLASVRMDLDATLHESSATAATLQITQRELAGLDRQTGTRTQQVDQLKEILKTLEGKNTSLQAEVEDLRDQGNRTRAFQGEGDRQYLTGLKVGGKRILILLDASASMLDETLVNIIRLRNMDDTTKRRAEKWQRALNTVEWLIANLPRTSLFQIYTFNVRAQPAMSTENADWLKASDAKVLNGAIDRLRNIVPNDGTSLFHALSVAKKLSPRPDNILLITDGLPTQDKVKPIGSKVSAQKRLKYFEKALKELPKGIPVNTILLPMEGDAYAAAAFWQLAVSSRGSFMTPSKDWP